MTRAQQLQSLRAFGRLAIDALALAGLALLLAGRWTWRHRQQIRAALVRILAAAIVAAQLGGEAIRWGHRQLLAISDDAARLAAGQPIPPLAPITATIEALRAALERLVTRLYPRMA